MDSYDFERIKPHLWAMFAAARLASNSGVTPDNAADAADAMLKAFAKRFPPKGDE